MGYRSNIVLVIPKTVKLESILQNNTPKILNKADDTYEKPDATFYLFEDWKWYVGYKLIDEIMNFIMEFKDDVGYIRIGENPEDIEVLGVPYEYDVYPTSTIVSPFN